MSSTETPVSFRRASVSRSIGPSCSTSYGGTPTLGVAVRRMPTVRKPAAAATVISSGGVVSSTVRCASEIGRGVVGMAEIVPQRRGSPSETTMPSTLAPAAMSTALP